MKSTATPDKTTATTSAINAYLTNASSGAGGGGSMLTNIMKKRNASQ